MSAALIEDTSLYDTIVSRPSAPECVRLVLTLPKVTERIYMKIQKLYLNSKFSLKSHLDNLFSSNVHFSNKKSIWDLNKVLGMVWDVNTDIITYNSK